MNCKYSESNGKLIALTQADPGQRVRICAITAGQDLRARLCAMGLMQGMTTEVIAVSKGPVILNVMGNRLALGHGMASKVQVKPFVSVAG